MYWYPNIENVKYLRGKFHEYYSVALDCTTEVEVKIYVQKYLKTLIDEIPINIEIYEAVAIPTTKNLFMVVESKPLNKNKA